MKTIKIAVIAMMGMSLGISAQDEILAENKNGIIKNYSPLLKLRRNTDTGGFIQGIQTQFKDGTPNFYFGNLHSDQWIISKGEYNGQRLLTVKSDGKFGIKTSEPKENLHVSGNGMIENYSPLLKLRRNTDTGGFIQGIQTQFKDGTPNFYFGNLHSDQWIISKGEYNGQRLLTVKSDGKFGIKTSEPKENLHVSGNGMIENYSPLLKLRRNTDTGGFIQGIQTQFKDGTPNFYFGNLHSDQWIISKGEYNGQRLLTVKSDGKFGIKTSEPKENLHVSGNGMIENYSPLLKLRRNTDTGGFIQGIQTQFKDGTPNFYFGNLHSGQWIISKGEYNGQRLLTVKSNGNAALNGKLEAKEIKVTNTPTADFVF